MPRPLLALLAVIASSLAAADRSYTIAVVPMGTTHEYWKSIHAGALKAEKELRAAGIPIEIIWKGPLREDDRDQQIQVVENFIGRRVSGIVLAPLDNHALAAPVEQATAAGIPVVIVDAPLISKAPVSVIATDNLESGRIAARHLGSLLGGKGNVILLRVQVGSGSCEAREAGFLDELAKKFPAIKVISSNQHGGATRETAFAVSQNLLNRHGKDVQGIFTPNESTTIGMMLALNQVGLGGGKVKLIGYANSQLFVDAVKRGDLQGLVVQDPVRMGYLGVKSIVQVLRGEKVPPLVVTAVGMATKENLSAPAIAALLVNPQP